VFAHVAGFPVEEALLAAAARASLTEEAFRVKLLTGACIVSPCAAENAAAERPPP
jgi:hypothetical protein